MTLDVGCGYTPRGDVNCDIKMTPCVDVICSAEALPFKDNVFEKAFSHHVVEHCTNPAKMLQEICRVAKTAEICTPNAHFPGWILHYVTRRGFFVNEPEHVYTWTPYYLTNLLRRLGISHTVRGAINPVRVWTIGRFFFWLFCKMASWGGLWRDIKVIMT